MLFTIWKISLSYCALQFRFSRDLFELFMEGAAFLREVFRNVCPLCFDISGTSRRQI